MNQRVEEALIQKIRQLSAERLAQVEDFIDFLATQERKRQAFERIHKLHERLPPAEITDEEEQELVDVVKDTRVQMRAERAHASRS